MGKAAIGLMQKDIKPVSIKLTVLLIIHLTLLLAAPAPSEESEELPQGRIIKKVICQDNPTQSYALYLPSDYTPAKSWPIIYGFDPAGQGAVPVRIFQAVGERRGYIIAGSNNSKNGPWLSIYRAIEAMWRDTNKRLSIDQKRIYTTGSSGGARVALETACLPQYNVAGVMAFSGGFGVHRPRRGMSFAFFGTAGEKELNRSELEGLGSYLGKLDIPHRIEIFEGGHSWPPKELRFEAIRWMEDQATKAEPEKREGEETAKESKELRVGGVIISPDKRIAIINGEFLQKGEKIKGYTVLEIREDRIELQKEGEKKILKIERE